MLKTSLHFYILLLVEVVAFGILMGISTISLDSTFRIVVALLAGACLGSIMITASKMRKHKF